MVAIPFLGLGLRSMFSLRSRRAFSVSEEKGWWVFSGSSVVHYFRSKVSLRLGRGLLLVHRTRVVFSVAKVCAGGSHYHSGEFLGLSMQGLVLELSDRLA